MLRKRSLVLVFPLCLALLFSTNASACACCAEHGTYSLWTGTPQAFRLSILEDIKFAPTGDLYMTEAGFDTIRGLASLEKDFMTEGADAFDIVNAYTKKAWQFEMKAPGGRAGTLVLPRPSKMSVFKVDTHQTEIGAGEATLYKEYRFSGTVANGMGFFAPSIAKPTTYSLVFQGNGNECDSSSDFTHWRLQVDGPRARYAFFGKLKNQINQN